MAKVLIVEDDPVISRSLKIGLGLRGFEVVTCGTIKEGQAALKSTEFDMMILDVELPDGNGFDLCQEIRAANNTKPILMLTARLDENSVVKGITLGADDYVRKPFGLEELVARMKRLLGRSVDPNKVLSYGFLSLNTTTHVAMFKDKTLNLSKKEFEILSILLKKSGQDVSREQVIAIIDEEGKMFDRTLDSHVSHLRQKLSEAGVKDVQIASVYGVGYRLQRV